MKERKCKTPTFYFTLVDCPTQLTLIFILWYLYLSVVFHNQYQSYKYERNAAGKSANSTPVQY